MNPALRFVLAGFASTALSMVVAVPTLVYSARFSATGDLTMDRVILVIAIVVVGGIIALILSCLFGGALILLSRVAPVANHLLVWLPAGAITGAGIWELFLDGRDEPLGTLIVLSLGGMTAAWLFRRIWMKTAPKPDFGRVFE